MTGITRGIGRAILPGLLAQGLHVVAVSRDMDKMRVLRDEIGVGEDRLVLHDCDLGDAVAVDATVRAIIESGSGIDAILHNAAVLPRHWFEETGDAFWREVLQINLMAAITLTRGLLPVLRRGDQGRILFTGSVLLDLGGACMTAYCASKGALHGITRSLAHELKGTGITVNCIEPGAIQVGEGKSASDAELISWQSVPRRLTSADLLGMICLLLSKWGGGITGQSFTIDGGLAHPLAAPEFQGRKLERPG